MTDHIHTQRCEGCAARFNLEEKVATLEGDEGENWKASIWSGTTETGEHGYGVSLWFGAGVANWSQQLWPFETVADATVAVGTRARDELAQDTP